MCIPPDQWATLLQRVDTETSCCSSWRQVACLLHKVSRRGTSREIVHGSFGGLDLVVANITSPNFIRNIGKKRSTTKLNCKGNLCTLVLKARRKKLDFWATIYSLLWGMRWFWKACVSLHVEGKSRSWKLADCESSTARKWQLLGCRGEVGVAGSCQAPGMFKRCGQEELLMD